MKPIAIALSLAMIASMALLSRGNDTPADQLTPIPLSVPSTSNEEIHITIDGNMQVDPFAPERFPITGISPAEIREMLAPLDARNIGDILFIECDDKDHYQVFSGIVQGYFDASGQVYDYTKTNDNWTLTRASAWSSNDISYESSSTSTNAPDPTTTPDLSKENFRITGVSIAEIRDILDQLDARRASRVLSIKRKASGLIEVMTGTWRGFLNADGDFYVFENINGKWTLTQESQWQSQQSVPGYDPQVVAMRWPFLAAKVYTLAVGRA